MGGQIWFCAEGEALYPFLSDLRAQGIRCGAQRCTANCLRARVSARRFKAVEEIAARHRLVVTVERRRGLRFHWYRVRHRWGLIPGGLLAAAVIFYCSNTITTIEINGNQTVPESAIAAALDEVGVEVGAFLPALNLRLCELDVRLEIPSLDWVGIRHTGGRVVVEVTEITPRPKRLPDHIPTNLVATKTALLEDVRCYDGEMVKQRGEAVKAGDIILSGVIEDPLGNITLHHAYGEAIGTYEEAVTFTQPYVEEVRVEEPLLTRARLVAFGHAIPLFFGDAPRPTEYAYWEAETPFRVFGKELPIGLRHSSYQPYSYTIRQYTPEEAAALLVQKQERYEAAVFANCEILEREIDESEGESMRTCQISYRIRGEIGAIREIFIK